MNAGNKLPEVLHQHFAPLAERATFMGVPIAELSRDDLIVVAMMGWEECRQSRDRFERDADLVNFLSGDVGKD